MRRKKKLPGNTRVTGTEQYYTPPETAAEVVSLVINKVPHWKKRLWIEPCGGTGTFIEAFEEAGVERILSMDIEPLHPQVEESNFLTTPLIEGVRGAITVTNPPFGRNNSLSIPFFNRAAEVSDHIAFIVPRSWRKWSVINRLHPNFHLIEDRELEINYLDRDGNDPYIRNGLNTIVQLWEKRSTKREKLDAEDRGYITKTTPANADVSLTIFGRGCGTVKTDFKRVPNTTQMFLKVKNRKVLKALEEVDYSRFYNNVAYTEALSIKEIHCLLNEHFDKR